MFLYLTESQERKTAKQICEEIREWMSKKYGYTGTAKDIWQMSPTGELWPVYELYEMMKNDK